MHLIFLGPPGAGKGTQAQRLAGARNCAHLSTGDVLRAACLAKTELGRQASSYMDKGELVPDDVICAAVAEHLTKAENQNGWILDGFPRTLNQAAEALETFGRLEVDLDACVLFELDEETLVRRISGRLNCRGCGRIFHISLSPPVEEGRCDSCGADLFQREDDTKETAHHRIAVYRAQTEPLIEFFEEKDLMVRVDTTGSQDEVFARVETALSDL